MGIRYLLLIFFCFKMLACGVYDEFPRTRIGVISNETNRRISVKFTKLNNIVANDLYNGTFDQIYIGRDSSKEINIEDDILKYFSAKGCNIYFYDGDTLRKYLKQFEGKKNREEIVEKAFLKKDTITPKQIKEKNITIVYKDTQ